MRYMDFAIEQNKKWLFETAARNSTPKRLAGHLFEAAEQITQLQEDLKIQIADVRLVKRGHWIYPDDYHIACTCSCCGWNGLLYESDVGGMPYCPSCGAKMDGEEQTQ